MQVEQDLPASVVVRVYLLGPLEVWKKDSSGTWKLVSKDQWKNSKPARAVFKRLLVQPGRRLARSTIEDDLWSEADNFELTTKNVYNAISLIRGIIGKPLVTCWEAAYEIAGQTLVWTDLDGCLALLKEAENRGQGRVQAIPFLEQAVALLERGELLEGEDGKWCYAFRKQAEDMFRQAHLWLAESYEAEGKLWQAGEQYRALILTNSSDEDALLHWLEMLARHGKRQEALRCYQEMKDFMDAQGFPLSNELEQVAASLNKQPPLALISPIQPLEDILLLKQNLGEQSMNYSRRQMLQGILAAACTTLTLAPYKFLPLEKRERLLASVHSPLYLSEDVLDDFSEITKRYWKLSANASLQLLNGLFGLFQDITQILMASQTPAVSEKLYSLSSEVAQLLGKTLFDLCDYPLACSYYGFALKAALEAHNYNLWAASLGRMGLLLLSNDQPQQAVALLEEAQGVSIQSLKIRSWHAAIEAEAYSYLGNSSACRKALARAKDTSEATFLEADIYATGFTRARLASYEGSCYLRLNQPESALPVLEQALLLIDPAAIRRLARLLTYLGQVHIRLEHNRQVYEYASQALDLTCQTQSLDILRHVRKLRDSFLARGENSYTKDLNRRIEETQAVIAAVGGFHG
jgi:DNA-binding SARP family transcriptional activator